MDYTRCCLSWTAGWRLHICSSFVNSMWNTDSPSNLELFIFTRNYFILHLYAFKEPSFNLFKGVYLLWVTLVWCQMANVIFVITNCYPAWNEFWTSRCGCSRGQFGCSKMHQCNSGEWKLCRFQAYKHIKGEFVENMILTTWIEQNVAPWYQSLKNRSWNII